MGEHIFGRSRTLRWVLGPPVLLTAVGMPIIVPRWTLDAVMVTIWLEGVLLGFLLVLIDAVRFKWAGRVTAGLLAAAYVGFSVHVLARAEMWVWPPSIKLIGEWFGVLFTWLFIVRTFGEYAVRGSIGSDLRFDEAELPLAGGEVSFDEEQVTFVWPGRTVETIRWSDLCEVVIKTTSAGPLMEDVFFVLCDDREGLIVPQNARGTEQLLTRLGELPGFDHEAMIEAMGCTSDREFVCWQLTRG